MDGTYRHLSILWEMLILKISNLEFRNKLFIHKINKQMLNFIGILNDQLYISCHNYTSYGITYYLPNVIYEI